VGFEAVKLRLNRGERLDVASLSSPESCWSRVTVQIGCSSMPSHSASPQPRRPPKLAPLVLPTSPRTSRLAAAGPHSAPAHERTPLLRSMPSLGPDDLKRQSHRFSTLLFQHNDTPLPSSDSHSHSHSPHPGHVPDDGYFQQHDFLSPTRPLAGRALSRARSSILGAGIAGNDFKSRGASRGYDGEFLAELEGEGGNGVRSWYGQSPQSLSRRSSIQTLT
jgi:hypothetical protein